jgi:4-amino-4-deoxy-L-arabinose transferase-like glycosyltransferase
MPSEIVAGNRLSNAESVRQPSAHPVPARQFAWILIAACAIRLALLWGSAGLGAAITDERHYAQIAASLADGNGFAWGPGQPTSIRPPLYPAFIATLWTITGTRALLPVRIAQALIALGSIVLVYMIARRTFDDKTALIAAAVFAFYPSLLFSGVLILTETLFLFLLLLTIHACLTTIETRSRTSAFAVGLWLGLAALTRSIVWPFVLVLVPFVWLALDARIRERVVVCALVVAGYVAVVAPWAIRNTRLQHVPTIVDTMGGINLLTGNYEYTPDDRMWDGVSIVGPHGWYVPLARQYPGQDLTEGEKERWARSAAIQYIAAHPATTLRRSVLKLADLWGLEREWVAGIAQGLYNPPLWFAIASSVLILVSYPLLVLLALAGFFFVGGGDSKARWLFVLLIAFVCAAHAATFGHSRYHLPFVPALAIYGAAALAHRPRASEWTMTSRAFVPVVLALLCAVVWAREILLRDADHVARLMAALQHL